MFISSNAWEVLKYVEDVLSNVEVMLKECSVAEEMLRKCSSDVEQVLK
jgi:hypothetical protein